MGKGRLLLCGGVALAGHADCTGSGALRALLRHCGGACVGGTACVVWRSAVDAMSEYLGTGKKDDGEPALPLAARGGAQARARHCGSAPVRCAELRTRARGHLRGSKGERGRPQEAAPHALW